MTLRLATLYDMLEGTKNQIYQTTNVVGSQEDSRICYFTCSVTSPQSVQGDFGTHFIKLGRFGKAKSLKTQNTNSLVFSHAHPHLIHFMEQRKEAGFGKKKDLRCVSHIVLNVF